MNERTFELPAPDELEQRGGLYWESALIARNTLVLEESPVGQVLPYYLAFFTYESHVARCEACQTSPVWDIGCETGAALAHISADAMAAQADLAAQN